MSHTCLATPSGFYRNKQYLPFFPSVKDFFFPLINSVTALKTRAFKKHFKNVFTYKSKQ